MHRLLATLALACSLAGARPTSAHRHPVLHRITAFITGYTATGNPTATGVWPVVGRTVAVDPHVIPLGSHLHIARLPGVFVAQDTGGAVVGNHVDVFVGSTGQAYAITSYRTVTWWR